MFGFLKNLLRKPLEGSAQSTPAVAAPNPAPQAAYYPEASTRLAHVQKRPAHQDGKGVLAGFKSRSRCR